MKAMVIKKPMGKVELDEREPPSPGRGDVLIRVHACGVCHGDLMVQAGAFPFAKYPIVPGHEIAGVVEAMGEGVRDIKPGARVGLSAVYSACGCCNECLSGSENICAQFEFTGVTKDGGYQEFMLAPAAYTVPIPEGFDLVEAAPLMCAGLSVYSSLRHAGFEPGDKVAVIGLGGLGHLGILYARAMGGRVAVLSTSAAKEAEAYELGAERFINTTVETASEALRRWDGGADVILATAPAIETMTAAVPGLAPDGTLVVLGAGPGELAVNPMVLMSGRRRVMGSSAGSRKDLRDALEFAAAHHVRPRVSRVPLEDAGEALDQLHANRIRGRAVLVTT